MNSSAHTNSHRRVPHQQQAQYEHSQIKGISSLEDVWPLPAPNHTGQHISFERFPHMPFLYFPEAGPRTSFSLTQLALRAQRDRSETGSIKSRYCDVENCDEKCSNDCEEDCDDTCSVVRCNGDCSLNDLDDNCEDCLRYNQNTCKEKDCDVQNCDGCQPCNDVCAIPEDVVCTSSHGPVCYSTSCSITPPQCSFGSCFPQVSHSQSFLTEGSQDVIPVSHDFSIGYNVAHDLQFTLPTMGDQSSIQDRPRKRRKEERSLIIQNAHHTSSATRTPTIFDQDNLPHSHLTAPVIDHYNYLCHWGESCQMGFTNYIALDDHVLQAHIRSQNGFTCQWAACGEAEKDLDQLVDHVKTSHTSNSCQGNGQVVCLWQGCNATFTNSEDLSHHLDTVHLQSPIGGLLCQWEACGVQADGPDGLSSHLHTDHFVPTAPSEHSGVQSSSKSPSVASPDQELICLWCGVEGGEICGKQFTSPDSLQQHAKDDHIATLKKKTGYFCLWAGCNRRDKQFSQKGKVERHMQTHTGFKSCRCQFCEKEFSAPQALQQHIRTHTGEKPYKCDICGKEFAQGSAMTMHKRVHTGERPLQCDFPGCGKRFSESSNLSKHRKTHNPVGQHRCGFPGCERSFHRIDQMKRHQKTHNPEIVLSPSPIVSGGSVVDQLGLMEPVKI